MRRRLRAFISIIAALVAPAVSRGAESKPKWTITSTGDVEFDFDTEIARATNGVVQYEDVTLTAREISLNRTNGQVVASGDVRVIRGTQVWSGDRIQYNLSTSKFTGEGFKSGQPPYFAQGAVVVADQKADVYVAGDAMATTDDFEKPGYSIRAQTIVIVPGEYIEAKYATLRLGSVPVFYFPFFRRSLKAHSPRFTVTPGYRSVHGPYLLTSYNWYWNERLDGALHLDGRLKRGVGFGPDLNYHLPRLGNGTFKYYYLRDDDPGRDPFDRRIDPDRQRFYFAHQGELWTNLTVRSAVRWQSDAYVIRDFFETEYRQNFQPSTFAEINQRWKNFTLDALVQPRVNEFFETVERLPDIKLTGLRQQVLNTPFYYEGDSSFGYYQRKFADGDTNGVAYAALRGDTYHQVVLPIMLFGWLNVTPRAGGRFTHYGETDGRNSTLKDQDRSVFNTGAEVSFKAARVWPGARNRVFGINGIRHILQPSINYGYVPRPSVAPRKLPQLDYEIPTTRLLPIEFPDYNAIDSIDSQNVLRFGLRNKLQTKRRDGIENVVHWALYTDWRLDPRDDQTTFSDVYSDLDLKPFSWLTLSSELRYSLDIKEWVEANNTATLRPNDRWSLTIGQRFLQDLPSLGPDSGNNLYFGSFYYRFNENWGSRISLHYEATDKTLEEQQYTIYRDFRAWTGAVTFRVRDNRDGPIDYTAAVTFSLKAFPRYDLGDDANKPSLLLGE
jgi:lipopolysaccharide assembly outer membrane protein LptD (OstA)